MISINPLQYIPIGAWKVNDDTDGVNTRKKSIFKGDTISEAHDLAIMVAQHMSQESWV